MTTFYDKTGLPKSLAWGFIGVLIFMMGDGIEQTWLSRYIASQGLDHEVLFTVYGISVALSAWFSGVIAETIGVRRTMLLGYLVYLVGMAGFAGIGMMGLNYPVLLVTYAIKGLGYPLFAYTFIVWIAYRVDKSRLSSAQGWFWFVFTGGLNVLGAYYGAYAMERIGVVPTLWSSLVFASVGAVLALWVNKCDDRNLFVGAESPSSGTSKFRELLSGYYEARTQGARRRNRARHQYHVAIRLRRFHAALFEGLRDRRHPVGVDLGFDLSVQHPLQSDLRDRRRSHRLGADDRVVRRRGVRRERAAILLCAGDLQ